MKIRLYNCRYLDIRSMTVKSGDLFIDGGKFTAEDKSSRQDRQINLDNNLVIPGFCNAHTHSPMVFLRSAAEGLPLDKWLSEAVFPNEAKLTPDDCYTLTMLAVAEYLSSGITSCFDMYFYPKATAKAFADTGFRAVLCGAVNNFSMSLSEIEDSYNELNSFDPLVSYRLGFHAEYTCSRKLMEGIAFLSEKYRAPVWCHSSETKKETEECIARYGLTPTALMDKLGLFQYGGGAYHCVYMTKEDIDIFRQKGLTAVTNPASNLKLASGIADICALCGSGVNIAIGTDGAASNNALDMFREMYLCTVLQKLKYSDASRMREEKVLYAATAGGAAAMGINSGFIEEGFNADFTVIDMHAPNMQPENSIVKNLVLSGSKSNVLMTAVNGNILYEKGEYHIGQDIEEIYSRVNKICGRIFGGGF